MKRIYLIGLLLLIVACGREAEKVIETDNYIVVGTFNLEWLGDGFNDRNDRSEEDYKNIADIIKKTEADVMAIQEVENRLAIRKVLNYLPDYDFILGSEGGSQNVCIICKKKISCKFEEEYTPIAVKKGSTRPGLIATVKKGNFDFYFMSVHFKSSSHWENTETKQERSRDIRIEQSQALAEWVDDVIKNSDEKDVLVAGDFNDTPVRKRNNTLFPISEDKNINFLTANMKSCKFRGSYAIDHIISSLSAAKRFLVGSEMAYDFRSSMSETEAKNISDHCPVIVRFDISEPDND